MHEQLQDADNFLCYVSELDNKEEMIPQAIASTGVYADLWSHLKSMDYALQRIQNAKNIEDVSDLDKARLKALSDFLKQEFELKDSSEIMTFQAFLSYRSTELNYSLESELRAMLQELEIFEEWLKPQNPSVKEKMSKLVFSIEDYLTKITTNAFPVAPKKEFNILHELLCKLLAQTESALLV